MRVILKIGIDLGGSHIGIGVLDDNNNIIKKIEKDIEKSYYVKNKIMNYIDENVSKIIGNYKIDLIGIAIPGTTKNLVAENIFNLGIEKMDFSKIASKYNIPLKIQNDSKAAGLAEKQCGSLINYKDAVFLCLGTGIGSAVFLNNELLISNKNVGFELGHMIIDKNGLQCNCGKKGCFETYCSIKRFKENVSKILNIREISPIELVNKIIEEKDNPKIKEIIKVYIENLIIGLSNIIDIFEPEAIGIGGSFVFFKEIFYEELIEEMNIKKYVFNKNCIPKIVLAELKNDAGIIGAVL